MSMSFFVKTCVCVDAGKNHIVADFIDAAPRNDKIGIALETLPKTCRIAGNDKRTNAAGALVKNQVTDIAHAAASDKIHYLFFL